LHAFEQYRWSTRLGVNALPQVAQVGVVTQTWQNFMPA